MHFTGLVCTKFIAIKTKTLKLLNLVYCYSISCMMNTNNENLCMELDYEYFCKLH